MINSGELTKSFERIGARVRIGPWPALAGKVRPRLNHLTVDVRSDDLGEFFDIQIDSVLIDLELIEVSERQRKLIIRARHLGARHPETFMCGHDGQSWFVAVMPDSTLNSMACARG